MKILWLLLFFLCAPTFLYAMEERIEVEPNCSICMDVFNVDVPIVKTGCNHIFHHHCLLQWLEYNPTCPACRRPVAADHLEVIPFERLDIVPIEQVNGAEGGVQLPADHGVYQFHGDYNHQEEDRRSIMQRRLGYAGMAVAGYYILDNYLLRRYLPESVRNLVHVGTGSSTLYYLLHRSLLRRLPAWAQRMGHMAGALAIGQFLRGQQDLPYSIRRIGSYMATALSVNQASHISVDVLGRMLPGNPMIETASRMFSVSAFAGFGLGLYRDENLSLLARQMSLFAGLGGGIAEGVRLPLQFPERRALQCALVVGAGEFLARSALPVPVRTVSRFAASVGGAHMPHLVLGAVARRYGYEGMWRPLHVFMFSTMLGRYHRESELSLLANVYAFSCAGWNHLFAGLGGFALGRGGRFFVDNGEQALAAIGARFFEGSEDRIVVRISRLIFSGLMSVINILF